MQEATPKKSALRRWLGGAATAAVLGLAAAMPVQAAVFVGTFDPQFGSPLTIADGGPFDLGWRGTVTVETTDQCLAQAGLSTTGVAVVGVGGCAASVLAASVGLYDMAAPTVDGATLSFDPLAFTVSFLQFDVPSANLLHLSTSFSNPVSTPYTAGFLVDPAVSTSAAFQWFSLEFLLGANLNDCGSGSASGFGSPLDGGCDPVLYSGPALWVDTADRLCMPGAETSRCTRSDLAEFPAELVFMRVPETGTPVSAPASLALVLLAAAAGAGATALRRARSGTRSRLSS
jgi:hypothetical protein